MGKEFYFETDDKFNRKPYAEFIEVLLINSELYSRSNSKGAYVIAIDSPWGTGKTQFVKMFENFLIGRRPMRKNGKYDKKRIRKPNKSRQINVIYYNSWETDFWGDALEPLISSIFNSDVFETIRADKDCDEVSKRLWDATCGILKAFGLGVAKNVMGEAAAELVRSTFISINKSNPDPIKAYKECLIVQENFKNALAQVINQTGKKLLVIIDELDRCRPNFAVQTLEIAKHLFNIDGLLFVFALDIQQLSSAVKTVYGHEIDAEGYLCRFFDYIGKLPEPMLEDYLVSLFGEFRLADNFYKNGVYEGKLRRYLIDLCIVFELSLRDVETVISTYKILFTIFLSNYGDVSAHELYLYLLCLKLKRPFAYQNLLKGRYTQEEIKTLFIETLTYDCNSIQNNQCRRFLLIGSNLKINEISYNTYTIEKGKIYKERHIESIKVTRNSKEKKVVYYTKSESSKNMDCLEFQRTESLDQVLFHEDLLKWDTIKALTLGKYYLQQLEMFNFAFPADETPPEA